MEIKEASNDWKQTIAAMFLVAGTCIGGGMLAIPVATGINGFIPSTAIMLLCWLGMTLSALFILEINLWMKPGAHFITMASSILGPIGKYISWLLYLFVCYASIVAYTSAGGDLMVNGLLNLIGLNVSKEIGCLIFILTFGGIVYLGNQLVGRVNTILFIAMIVSYFALVTVGMSEVKTQFLRHRYWANSLLAIPLLLTSFSFQTVIPSLTLYLNRHAQALRWAIVGGTTIVLLVYLIWQGMVLGIVPVEGPSSLMQALEEGNAVTQYLRVHVQSSWISSLAEYFAFFALVTSFLGIALGLFDFLADGLKLSHKGIGGIILGLLITVPTFIFAVYFERIFIIALETTGGFGDSILNGIMPALMVWIGRYKLRFPNENRVFGGKPLIIGVFAFFALALILEILTQAGYA